MDKDDWDKLEKFVLGMIKFQKEIDELCKLQFKCSQGCGYPVKSPGPCGECLSDK